MAWDILGYTLVGLVLVAVWKPRWLAARLRPLVDLVHPRRDPERLPDLVQASSPDPLPSPPQPAPAAAPESAGAHRLRLMAALVVAGLADTVLAPLGEAAPVVFDLAVAAVLALILGPRAPLMIALVAEAIPGVGLFPSWLAAVGALAVSDRAQLTGPG